MLTNQPIHKDMQVHYKSDLGDFSVINQSKSQASMAADTTLREVLSTGHPTMPNSSFRNVTSIVETTNNLIQTLDYALPLGHNREGVRVEDLINKFKNDAHFDTMAQKVKKNGAYSRLRSSSSAPTK